MIVVLAKVFIPAIAGSNSGGEDGGDSGGQTIGNMTIRNIDPLFFLTIFYYGVTMQALGNGSMAGLMSTGRFSTGFKHSGMMIVVALVVFNLVAFSPDLIGITEVPGLNPFGNLRSIPALFRRLTTCVTTKRPRFTFWKCSRSSGCSSCRPRF